MNYTFAPSLKGRATPRREEEAACSPVHPNHLFRLFPLKIPNAPKKLSQATALVSQETPAIPIRRKQTKNSWPHMHALVYREESQLMTNNQGESWKQSGGSSNHPSHQAQRHCSPMHISLAIRAVAFPYHHSKKKFKKRSFPVQLRSSVEGSVSSKKLGIVDEVLSSQFCLAAASRVFGQISK